MMESRCCFVCTVFILLATVARFHCVVGEDCGALVLVRILG